jgi:hypothetical protein
MTAITMKAMMITLVEALDRSRIGAYVMRVFRWLNNLYRLSGARRMSDPSELNKPEPHPVSGHRTPREIAEDEAGPIGDKSNRPEKKIRADQGPVRKLVEPPERPADSKPEPRGRPRSS